MDKNDFAELDEAAKILGYSARIINGLASAGYLEYQLAAVRPWPDKPYWTGLSMVISRKSLREFGLHQSERMMETPPGYPLMPFDTAPRSAV